jgi:hypothetical protein
MRPVLVKELAHLLSLAVKEGYGDYVVQVSDDEECNGYHPIYQHNFGIGEDVRYLDEKTNEMRYRNSLIID